MKVLQSVRCTGALVTAGVGWHGSRLEGVPVLFNVLKREKNVKEFLGAFEKLQKSDY